MLALRAPVGLAHFAKISSRVRPGRGKLGVDRPLSVAMRHRRSPSRPAPSERVSRHTRLHNRRGAARSVRRVRASGADAPGHGVRRPVGESSRCHGPVRGRARGPPPGRHARAVHGGASTLALGPLPREHDGRARPLSADGRHGVPLDAAAACPRRPRPAARKGTRRARRGRPEGPRRVRRRVGRAARATSQDRDLAVRPEPQLRRSRPRRFAGGRGVGEDDGRGDRIHRQPAPTTRRLGPRSATRSPARATRSSAWPTGAGTGRATS